MDSLARSCNAAVDNEASGVLQLRLHLAAGKLADVLGVKPFIRHKFEFLIKGLGFADLALFHADHGVTLVEAKGPHCNRMLVAGIGQLFMYEAALRANMGGRAPAYVDKILCAPVTAEESMPTWRACELAGVRFVHLACYRNLRAALDVAGR